MKKFLLPFVLLFVGNICYSMEQTDSKGNPLSIQQLIGTVVQTEYGSFVAVSDPITTIARQIGVDDLVAKVTLRNGSFEELGHVFAIMNRLAEIVMKTQHMEEDISDEEHRLHLAAIMKLQKVCAEQHQVFGQENEITSILRKQKLTLPDGQIPSTVRNIVNSAFTSSSILIPRKILVSMSAQASNAVKPLLLGTTHPPIPGKKYNHSWQEEIPTQKLRFPIAGVDEDVWPSIEFTQD